MSILRKIVEKKKVERYTWPDGWMTREQAANDLGVAPRDVDDELREAIRDGDVLKEHFSMYCPKQKRVIRMPGYKVASKDESQKQPPKEKPEKASPDFSMERKIREAIKKYPRKTNREIAKCIYKCTSAMVQAVREGGTL